MHQFKNSIQNGNLSLEIEKQDINLITININNDSYKGLINSANNINLHIGITLCELFFD